jgi:hypothetical protein
MRLRSSISHTSSGKTVTSRVDEVALALDIGSSHVVRIPVDPLGLVQPGQDLLQEGIGIALAGVDAELGDPDRLLEGVMELGEVVLEVLGVVGAVVVRDDKVDLAVAAAGHELLEVADALGLLAAVGHGGRANLESLAGKGLDELPVRGNGLVDGNVGASATVGALVMCCGGRWNMW